MADPRLNVGMQGIGAKYLTVKIDNSEITYDATADGGTPAACLNHAVSLSAADTIDLAADGEFVLGKLIKVESDLMATVQYLGGMTLPGGNGASLTLGKAIVGALDPNSAKGHIREVATGTAAELGRDRGFIIDAGTTTAVEVFLE